MLEEFLVVFAHSKKTQFVLVLGVLFFFAFLLTGKYFSEHLAFRGVLEPLTVIFQEWTCTLPVDSFWFDLKRVNHTA